MQELDPIRDAAWLYVAGPLLALAAIWFTIRLAAPQVMRLAAGVRAIGAHDPKAEGELAPSAATWLASAGLIGAAAAVGGATAVALGGAGVIGWVWLFCFLLAPLRFAETLLARTDAPGRTDAKETGSLARRLARDAGRARPLGMLVTALLLLTAFAFVGGVHGAALADASAQLLPGSMPFLGLGVAAMAAILALGGAKRAGPIAGWLGLAGAIVLLAAGLWAAGSNPSRALGALGRAVGEAFSGAPPATPFVGAFAGEVAAAAMLHLLPPIAATTGAAGAVHAGARAKTTRGQAAAALVGPLVYAVVTTVLCMAFVATGAYYRRTESSVPLTEVRIYTAPFETASQRAEPERLHEGYVRIRDGETRDIGLHFATPQGTIRSPRFLLDGEPADVALHVDGGAPLRILVPEEGVLVEADVALARQITVEGEMLPRGGALLASALARGSGGDIAPRLALGALLVLLAVCGATWGFAAARSLRPGAPAWARYAVAALPALGIALYSFGVAPWLAPMGGIFAAAAAVAAVGLLLKTGEVRGLLD